GTRLRGTARELLAVRLARHAEPPRGRRPSDARRAAGQDARERELAPEPRLRPTTLVDGGSRLQPLLERGGRVRRRAGARVLVPPVADAAAALRAVAVVESLERAVRHRPERSRRGGDLRAPLRVREARPA